MKIALIAEEATPLTHSAGTRPASQETRVTALARELVNQDHDVTVFARKDAADLPDHGELPGGVAVRHVTAGPAEGLSGAELLPHMRTFAARLGEFWRGQQPDVVHAVCWTGGLAALAGARDQDIPVVQTFHSLSAAERRHHVAARSSDGDDSTRSRLERAIARSADAVVANNSDETIDLARLGVPRSAISVVPFGVDTEQFSPDGPVAPRSERPRLVAVATHLERDGLETAVRAMSDIPETELLIVGGPERKMLRKDDACCELARLAGGLGVSDRVMFTGRVSHGDMPALLRSADLLVDMSWYEPFGMATLEAMACGTPVVASAIGGHRDTVVDGTTGMLVPPGQPALLARRIRRLLANPMLLEGYGIAAADRARARYSWDRVGRETVSVYDHARRPGSGLEAEVEAIQDELTGEELSAA
ncbi:MAG TPA: glycosyltransferase [Streptosporangiaceae bacterium]|jgi:glycosyltransferase involved in cell wall biosynthesis|nr:glycosyltransferase [Streptosporangiaceae bacterium]